MIKRIVLVCAVLALCECGQGYSDGDRSGIVTKFSYKGLVWKSWEGEANLGGMKTTHDSDGNAAIVANTWEFHVSDPAIVEQVQKAQETGARVTLHYRQWWISPCTQDSGYDVVSVKVGE